MPKKQLESVAVGKDRIATGVPFGWEVIFEESLHEGL
jgi:hypothetical protein